MRDVMRRVGGEVGKRASREWQLVVLRRREDRYEVAYKPYWNKKV